MKCIIDAKWKQVEAVGMQREKCQDKKTMTIDTYTYVRIRNLEMNMS